MATLDEHFRLLVDLVEEYAIYLLDPAGLVRSWNPGARRLKGYEASEIVGRHFSTFFSEDDRASGKPAQLLASALAEGHVEDVGWRVRRDGTLFWANVVITALRDHSGEHVGFAKITRDLTDRGYRAFVEATNAIVWTTDATGRPNTDSPTWRAFTGQTEEEWRGRRGWDPVHPDDLSHVASAWTEAKASGRPLRVEFRLRRRDGVYVWMGAQAVAFHDRAGSVREWFGVTFDISERKRAEEERERAVQLWTTTLRSIGDAVVATDSGGLVTFLNPVAEELTGWTSIEATGRTLAEVFPIYNEETGAAIENPVAKVLREGIVVGLANHTVLRRRGGHLIPIADSAAPIRRADGTIDGVVLVFRDATAEKLEQARRTFVAKATEELVAAADYRDALRRVAALAVPRLADWAAIDIVEGDRTERLAVAHIDPAKVEYAHELARRYPPDPAASTGVPNVLRTGKAELYPVITPEMIDASAADDEHRRILRELDLRSALIVPLHGREGIFGAMSLIRAGATQPYDEHDLAYVEDVARRAALIIERRRVEEEAATANRMKDEFLATVSHELRTPLQAILGYGTMLERGMAKDPAKALAAILRNAEVQARLIEDILDMSSIMSGKLRLHVKSADLGAAVHATIEALRPAATAKNIQIQARVPDQLYVRGDPERLQQVFSNLLSNAVKFTDAGGSIEIEADRPTASSVTVRVRDNGRGIAREHLSTIFDRFRQVDSTSTRPQGGLGLGLAIVRHLVQAHGGSIEARSDGRDRGATFEVTLPLQVPAVIVPPEARSDAEPPTLRGVRILVVDDEQDARDLVAEALTALGARVQVAATAADALERLQLEPPHVLVSDIGMPVEDGYALIRRVRALPAQVGGDVPAIALTAYARAEDVAAAHDAGFQLHVAKPVRLAHLVDAIRGCVRPA